MEPFRHHVFVCRQEHPEDQPCCAARGAGKTIAALRRALEEQGLLEQVQVTPCESLGLCREGPNLVVYPEGVWYSGVTPEDAAEIVRSHLLRGIPVARLIQRDPRALAAEIRRNSDSALAAARARKASRVPPDDLMTTIRGYQESRIILTGIELDVFTAAGDGAGPDEIASRCGADARAVELLLNALAAMGLLRKTGSRFSTTPVSERYLTARGNADARAAMLHQSSLWPRWARLSECVRAGTSVDYQEMAERGEEWTEPFIAAMHLNAVERAGVVVPAVGVEGVRRMLDLGGGSGAYSIAFARAGKNLHAEILDLETVLPIARRHIEKAGLADRVTTRSGDLRMGALGSGYDLIFASAICHAFSEEENQSLVRRCHDALARGGRLVIQDFILDEDGTSPARAALFSITMLVATPQGRSYREREYAAWMKSAGLSEVGRIALPGPADLIVGRRP